jgi:xanthine dehydrogenase accessory factor
MEETAAILAGWREVERRGGTAVLATVVHVEGSAYRRPGARMLIGPDGRHVGSISGGCLETDVCRKAWWMTEDGRPTVRVYDTTSEEDDAAWEFGLGCNGVVHVLLERLDHPAARQTLEFLADRRTTRQPGVIATIVHAAAESGVGVGDRLLVDQRGLSCGGGLEAAPLAPLLRGQARACLEAAGSRLLRLEGCVVFLEFVAPPQPLVIFGAGHDAVPLVAFATQLGWHVTVADGRPTHARRDRFPAADQVLLLPRHDPLAALTIDAESNVVVMTHNFPQDVVLLRALLPARPRYLGLLGSQRRAARLLAAVGAPGAVGDLHAPVGLDIGADTPELIALAIVAEIQAASSGREGGKMRLRRGSIHAPVLELGRAEAMPLAVEHPVCALAAGNG